MKALFFVISSLTIQNSTLFSQSNLRDYYSGVIDGQMVINQDERLDELVSRYININKDREGMPGFRIRIFSESGQNARQNATNARAIFFNKFPDIETYLVWDAPNFKVYIGDFRTRSEALKIQREIGQDYPYSFIVNDVINFPSLD